MGIAIFSRLAWNFWPPAVFLSTWHPAVLRIFGGSGDGGSLWASCSVFPFPTGCLGTAGTQMKTHLLGPSLRATHLKCQTQRVTAATVRTVQTGSLRPREGRQPIKVSTSGHCLWWGWSVEGTIGEWTLAGEMNVMSFVHPAPRFR